MVDLMATSQMVQSDYGLTTEYSNVLHTSSILNGKEWNSHYPPITPSARYVEEQQTIETKIAEDIELSANDWFATFMDYFNKIKKQQRNKEIQYLVAENKMKHLHNVYFTFEHSLEQCIRFLSMLLPHLRLDFMPAVAIDNEGEIDFEWYGRHGARASVTIGANGVLYFVSLFHGNRIKSRLTWLDKIPPIILTELDKIYKDKQL